MKNLFLYSITFIAICFFSQANSSECPVDVYGTNKISAEWVCSRYQKEITNLIETLKKDDFAHIYELDSEKIDHRKMIIDQIKKKLSFEYVDLAPVIYQDRTICITVDIVEKGSKRLSHFLPSPIGTISGVDELLKAWDEYERIGGKLMFTNRNFKFPEKCPAFHCIFGFEDPQLKKYEKIFTQKVPLAKEELVAVLKFDKDPNKRSSAAYLLAHIENAHELASVLTAQIFDPHPHVRNSILRVLGSLLSTETIPDFPKEAVIIALDFPNLTDRNKALSILSALAQNQENHQYILQKTGPYLIANLKMKQPNVHFYAYDILKLISSKNFDEHDYAEWEKWLREAVA